MRRPRDTRKEIIEAAIRLLGRDGPDRFSASALAREVGISKANLFHHFPNLNEIPLAAFDQLGEALFAPSSGPPPSPREWLQQMGEATLTLARDKRDFLTAYFVFFGRALFDERMRERFARTAEPMIAAITEQMARVFPGEEAETTGRLVAMTLDGLALHVLTLGEEEAARRAWGRFVDIILPEKHS